ncbi:SNF1-interacting protein [Didymella pomorum]|uniref:SNF1-interacting protein n=1 Tax=Didymella pomorum TaxID=749634 RepID=A0A9W9D7B8_9PLEO|nr:SNF1-interacting protein [Didymella pomorum]
MGNSQGKESQPPSRGGHVRRSSAHASATSPTSASGPSGPSHERSSSGVGLYSARSGRGSRHDLSFLGIGGSGNAERDPALEPRRETKAEREARKLEKERVLRAQERERSIKEEGVDGAFLVTLGTYTGPEDFSKPVVRQLQIERRLAPFWKGLDDHSDTWTEHQLVAVANGLPLPAPDEIPPEEPPRPTNHLSPAWNPRSSDSALNNLTVPMGARTMSQNSDRSGTLSPSHPAFSLPSPASPIAQNTQSTSSSSPFFRGRAKTLASLASGSRNASQTEMAPQELQLPKDPYVNGQRVEVFLYKNASECPICFLYYPPYLNKTRCCDQPICSECFVQIKRPDPHPPEHHGEEPPQSEEPQEEIQLVSEPAACPFCVQPEFGVTYEPPPFRRGLIYAHQTHGMHSATSAMSSTTSVNSSGVTSPGGGRRRATSLAVNDKTVITTDMVRPDWAKKLADAKSHALRRAAAATALHNAAYMMGNIQQQESRGFGIGRRRRTMFSTDSGASSGVGTPRREGEASSGRGESSGDLFPGRHSSRRGGGNRLDDLEELMMMEAIRLSLAAEEERKRKDDKEAAKEAKKEEKKKAKENKKVAKEQRKIGSGFHPVNVDGLDDTPGSSSAAGKGKAVDRSGGSVGFNPLSEPTSTINAPSSKESLKGDAQRHLEDSRAQIQGSSSSNLAPSDALQHGDSPSHRSVLRNLSNDSSSASSYSESVQETMRDESQTNLAPGSSYEPSPSASGLNLSREETPPGALSSTEPMFNFSALQETLSHEDDKAESGAQFIEDVGESKPAPLSLNGAGPSSSPVPESSENAEPLAESTVTLKASEYSSASKTDVDDDEIEAAPPVQPVSENHTYDQKHIGEVGMLDHNRLSHQATQ